jgi:hypothetical protein
MTNILQAINNFANNQIIEIVNFYKSNIKIQHAGDALEFYIKDIFCNTLEIADKEKKEEEYRKYFSFLGNANNPPDFMIKSGDAVEVKKIESLSSSISLNSSFPKDVLCANDSLITDACRDCEDWTQKDVLYAIGSVKDNKLKSLWLVYGGCFAAEKTIYERIRNTIIEGVNGIEGVEFSKTNEVGRINKVDPLGITYLRIRGMWGVEHPKKIFDQKSFKECGQNILNSIILLDKYRAFPKEDVSRIEKNKFVNIVDCQIKNPNNPAELLEAKFLYIKKS